MANKKRTTYAEHKWDTVWKALVTTNGRLDKAKVMQELADFSILIEEAAKVYHHVSGGQITTVRVMSEDVIAAATEADNAALAEILVDEKAKWESERLEDVCYVRLGSPTLAFEGRHILVTIPSGTYSAAWCSTTDQLFVDDAAPLPADWVDTAKEAAKALLGKEI